jgi:hypothetical protein
MGIVATVFGIFWVAMAVSMEAPILLTGFGVVFILCAAGGAVYNFYNATARRRFSAWDVTEAGEERDPLDASPRGGEDSAASRPTAGPAGRYCPYCGTGVRAAFTYCPSCGKPLPKPEA